ncbi:MAG: BLUF domain-containing protein [Alcaligenaceae bacterium]|nr:MAG: BLUF domain-containing protein [Alcaligenaceae bacterium]
MTARLIYTSRAHELTPAAFALLMKQSRLNNHKAGIRGGLAILGGVFLQYLEGEVAELDRLYAAIQIDPRHTGLRLLERRENVTSFFDGWAMAELSWTDETRSIFFSFSPGKPLDLYEIDGDTAAPMFRAWAKTSAWTGTPPIDRVRC